MKSKKGFTIIEVLLVMAISGLIITAIAIAVPALVHTQRDNDRRRDFEKLIGKINEYQSNNRKALPSFGTAADGTVVNQIYFEGGTPQAVTSTEWNGFMTNYLMQPFEDPNGTPYNISITSCSSVDGAGSSCEDTNYFQTKSTKKAIKDFFKPQFPNDYTVLIVVNGKCFSSEKVIYTPGNRTVAVLYKLESGGTFCENN